MRARRAPARRRGAAVQQPLDMRVVSPPAKRFCRRAMISVPMTRARCRSRRRTPGLALLDALLVHDQHRRAGRAVRATAAGQQVGLGEQVGPGDGGQQQHQYGRRTHARHGDVQEALQPGRPVGGRRLVQLLADVLQGGQVEQDVEPDALPGHEERDRRHGPGRVDQPGRVGRERAEQLVDQAAAAEQEQPDPDHRDARRHVRHVERDPQEGLEPDDPIEQRGQHQRDDDGQRNVDDQEDADVDERLRTAGIGEERLRSSETRRTGGRR